VNLYTAEEMGKGQSYVAPDPHFVSTVALYSSSLPWDRFKTFFETRKMVNLSGDEQLILLRLIALQELLCLDDEDLLRWSKHQLYLFSFMQPDFKPKLPTVNLLREFRREFDKVGLLKPFRKQCQRLIAEHDNRFPPLNADENIETSSLISKKQKTPKSIYQKKISDTKVDLPNVDNNSDCACPNCGSLNVIKLKPSQEASSLPDIRFSRCRFCGNTFRQ